MANSLTEFPAYQRLPFQVQQAQGNYLLTETGTRMLDLYGGHCVNTLGAGDPEMLNGLIQQWSQCSFTTNLLDTPGRAHLLQALAPGLPDGSWQLFCSNSGAEANENLLKLALHATSRSKVICFEGAFHGRTAAAAAVSDSRQPAWPATPFQVHRNPWGCVSGIDASVAAVILEPIQSLAGVIMPPDGFLQKLKSACKQVGALLLFDEVQTGNGRLGTMWASQHFHVIPDGFTTAKGCAGGFPFGMTFLSDPFASRVSGSLCGSTFGGGPMAIAAAIEVQQRLNSHGFLSNVHKAGKQFQLAEGVGPIESVHGVGLLLGLKVAQPFTARQVRDSLLKHGVLTGLCNDPQVLRVSPALTLTATDVDIFLHALDAITVPHSTTCS
jgi:acetylornithine/N-succinyldiaminopimelate aminotransferase